jgi:hypothetical protein
VISLTLTLPGIACGFHQADTQVTAPNATLKNRDRTLKLFLIDGKKPEALETGVLGGKFEVPITPGQHTITVSYYDYHFQMTSNQATHVLVVRTTYQAQGLAIGPQNLSFLAVPGHSYVVDAVLDIAKNSGSYTIVDEADKTQRVPVVVSPLGGPIHAAAAAGDVKKVEELLKGGPDLVSSKTELTNQTPLHLAAENGRREVAALLLANKAEVDFRDSARRTPLHLAAQNGRREAAELLLANKADVNAAAAVGMTPLYMAAQSGQLELVGLLLANNADVNAKTDFGMTPLGVALASGHKDVAELLRKHGGRTR